MLKKILIISYIVLSTTLTHAADKWSGPTTPIDPMWGLKGSSIMVEALRTQPQSNPLMDLEREGELKKAYEKGKGVGRGESNSIIVCPLIGMD